MFIKNMPFEVKADTGKREFEGYASTWKKDLVGDQIMPGAFKKTVSEQLPKNKIKILWQHGEPLGKPLEMYEDSKGLYVRGWIAKTSLGNDALELMKEGIVDEMSIGYDVLQDELTPDGSTRLLKELKLYEVSPVTFGANPDTSINSVKSLSLLNELQPARLAMLLKEGRAISASNMQRLQQARAHLDEIIQLIEGNNENEKALRQIQSTQQSQKGSTQEDFVAECMHRLHERYPDQQQRLAICFSEWADKSKNKAQPGSEIKELENIFDNFINLAKRGK